MVNKSCGDLEVANAVLNFIASLESFNRVFLTKAGIVNKEILRSYRKHAIVVILVFGAMLTPPDPFSQIVMAIPLVGLYEISILISSKVKK